MSEKVKWDLTKEGADYHRNYNRQHYDNLRVACPKGTLATIDEAAKALGMSRAAFVLEAVREKIEAVGR